ncbi:TetR/AcrR family transcriptional regulator [Amycolatopsis sp. NBC_00348]|uniref:TetR/AcrR family transcriptional regulator n=1 Tax=Amycolatopsis sp. NBC_00348 TaxID=2975956 RepID=UPI002E27361C
MRADALRNRERIAAAALTLFAERGPDVCMDTIAQAAGVGVGTLYRHFPDRQALLLDIAAGALRDLIEFGAGALEREDTGWQALVAIVRFCAGLPLALAKSLAGSLPAGTGLPELEQESDDLFARVVQRAQGEGAVRRDIPPPDVVALLAVVVCRPGARPDDHLTTVMLDGLRQECVRATS